MIQHRLVLCFFLLDTRKAICNNKTNILDIELCQGDVMDKIEQTPNQVDEQIDDIKTTDDDAIERDGYGKSSYKRIQKLRKKGIQYGIPIPKCKFPLEKPNTPRKLMLVSMWACLIGIVSVVGLAIWLFIKIKYFTAFGQVIGLIGGTVSEEVVSKTLGFSGLVTASALVVLIVLILMMLIPIIIVWLLANRASTLHELAYASRQEIAVGYKVKSMIKTAICLAIIMLAVLIFGLIKGLLSNRNGIIAFCILLIGIVVFTIYAVSLIFERKKDKAWFDTLSKEAQDDYLAHNEALFKLAKRSNKNSR